MIIAAIAFAVLTLTREQLPVRKHSATRFRVDGRQKTEKISVFVIIRAQNRGKIFVVASSKVLHVGTF